MVGQRTTEAEALFTRTFRMTTRRFADIIQFRQIANLGTPAAMERVYADSLVHAFDVFHSEEHSDLFIDRDAALKAAGGEVGFAKSMVTVAIRRFGMSVDSASLVFAHSILDGAAFEYCRVTALESPEDWFELVNQRKVEIRELEGTNFQELKQKKINEFLLDFERVSLQKKIERLFAICRPSDEFVGIKDFKFDRDRLKKFDDDRHQIVHGEPIDNPLPEGDADIWFLLSTSNYLMTMIHHRFGLKIDPYEFSGIKPPAT